ncbi:hypothetical protein A6S26_32435 [Nostoc sp. ATCC 43529]|nr:hypothetical protein A6S26_32435 [Nostoc sp. ATCC 43529]
MIGATFPQNWEGRWRKRPLLAIAALNPDKNIFVNRLSEGAMAEAPAVGDRVSSEIFGLAIVGASSTMPLSICTQENLNTVVLGGFWMSRDEFG